MLLTTNVLTGMVTVNTFYSRYYIYIAIPESHPGWSGVVCTASAARTSTRCAQITLPTSDDCR